MAKKKQKQEKLLDPDSLTDTMIMTRSVFSGQRRLKYFWREKPYGRNDSGWRAVGDGDTQGYLNHIDNDLVVDLHTACSIEPLLGAVLNQPEGTEYEMAEDELGRHLRLSQKEEPKLEKPE